MRVIGDAGFSACKRRSHSAEMQRPNRRELWGTRVVLGSRAPTNGMKVRQERATHNMREGSYMYNRGQCPTSLYFI